MAIIKVDSPPQPIFEGKPSHSRYWDLNLNLSGSGVMTAGNQTYPFKPGTLFCVPPWLSHKKSSPDGYTDICIYTSTFLSQYDKELLVLQDDELQTVRQLFLQMHGMYSRRTIARGQLLEELLHVLLTWILLQRNANKLPQSVQEITTKLEQNFLNPNLSVTPLLHGYNYCPEYVRQLFKKYHGCSPYEYLMALRLEHAKILLRAYYLNNYTIPQIALSSGFTDPNYFSRVFKKYNHLTPLQYAKQIAR